MDKRAVDEANQGLLEDVVLIFTFLLIKRHDTTHYLSLRCPVTPESPSRGSAPSSNRRLSQEAPRCLAFARPSDRGLGGSPCDSTHYSRQG